MSAANSRVLSQSKYKEGSRKSLSQSFYSQLSETAETQFAKSVAGLQSEVSPASTRQYKSDQRSDSLETLTARVNVLLFSGTVQGRG